MNLKIEDLESKIEALYEAAKKKGFTGYEIYQKEYDDKKSVYDDIALNNVEKLFSAKNGKDKIVLLELYKVNMIERGANIEYQLYEIKPRIGKSQKMLGLEINQK